MSKRMKLLLLSLAIAWLYQATFLYPLPAIGGIEKEVSVILPILPSAISEAFLMLEASWYVNFILVVVGVTSIAIAAKSERFRALAVFISSVLYVLVWWWGSGLFDDRSSFISEVIGRWYYWPTLLLKQGRIEAFLNLILHDYILFGLFHMTAITSFIVMIKRIRKFNQTTTDETSDDRGQTPIDSNKTEAQ